MAVRLSDLSDRMSKLGVRLVAGRAGMNRTVRWVHMVESVDATEFLDGQELACMTGIGVQQGGDAALEELVRVIAAGGASGVLINIGPYVERIPPSVIDFCEERTLPLFLAPWHVHLARVMHMISLTVTLADQENLELTAALKNALFKPDQESLYLEQIQRAGYQREWNYCVGVIYVEEAVEGDEPVPLAVDSPVLEADAPADALLRRVRNIADDIGTLHRWRMTSFVLEGKIVLVFADYQLDAVRHMARDVIVACRAQLGRPARIFTGVGKITRSARCIGKSYGQALRIAQLQRQRGRANELCLYDTMGAEKLLVAVDDPDILSAYSNGTVGKLVAYDETHGSGLIEVLDTYLAHNGSLQQTADLLFVHRNTVSYKLNKIASILDADLSDFQTRVELYLGLRARELCLCQRAR